MTNLAYLPISEDSECDTAALSELDFCKYTIDHSFGSTYLHVHRKSDDTWHRVYCRKVTNPRVTRQNGVLCWAVATRDYEPVVQKHLNLN